MFSPHFESWGRDSSHAGWGCQFSINLLPRLICRLHSESAWDHFSAMQSWWKVPTWPAIWGQTGELICASSPSGRAHAALLHLHLLIFSTTFVSCSCLMSLIPPPRILVHSSFVFLFVVANTPQKSQSLSSSRQTKRVVILWHLAALHQPLSTALCSFSFSSSAPSLPIIYSVLSDGPR